MFSRVQFYVSVALLALVEVIAVVVRVVAY